MDPVIGVIVSPIAILRVKTNNFPISHVYPPESRQENIIQSGNFPKSGNLMPLNGSLITLEKTIPVLRKIAKVDLTFHAVITGSTIRMSRTGKDHPVFPATVPKNHFLQEMTASGKKLLRVSPKKQANS